MGSEAVMLLLFLVSGVVLLRLGDELVRRLGAVHDSLGEDAWCQFVGGSLLKGVVDGV